MKRKLFRVLPVLLLFYSCRTVEIPVSPAPPAIEPIPEIPAAPAVTEPVDIVRQFMDSLTVEEKIGQMIFINIRDISNSRSLEQIDDFLKKRMETVKPGGVILFGGNLKTIPQTVKLIDDLQNCSSLPLFISADVEGGRINRLTNSPEMHATDLPSNREIGRMPPEAAEKKARIIAREMSALQINMNFAPVADVLSNPENQVIGERSFGSDPLLVGNLVAMTVKVLKEEGVVPVIKHFPGHGDTFADTHLGSVSVTHDIERLTEVELVPFVMGLEAGSPALMTAHIQVPRITENDLPSTLSPEIITNILREKLEYNGLVISDSLGMGAITRRWDSGESALLAIRAGVDILLNPQFPEEAYSALLKAYNEGLLTMDRIDESVYRIIRTKMDFRIMNELGEYTYRNSNMELDPELILGCEDHNFYP